MTSLDAGRLDYVALTEHIRVADSDQSGIVRDAALAYVEARDSGTATIATALHVGGLNAIKTAFFPEALQRARLVYADGVAVVLLAKLAGAANIRRAATTDIGIPVVEAIAKIENRPARVALVGGRADLAEIAGAKLGTMTNVELVFATDGYKDHVEWQAAIADLRNSNPDIILLGIGSPQELIFADRYLADMPPALIMTCGGWFGFLAGDERRAPALLRATGFEWLGRLAQDPRRLAVRYGLGAFTFASMGIKIVTRRMGIWR
ncbi:WecB/TagA/CpsF family glycosyltransferase [Pseudarthrobacter sp. S6]|uniref:WecB/TagA/CpsF family glycosyltransferase n=1 Tax=Pseudarthrobacter sp. S6 TaxID=3418420 RepID=UPI003CF57792